MSLFTLGKKRVNKNKIVSNYKEKKIQSRRKEMKSKKKTRYAQ